MFTTNCAFKIWIIFFFLYFFFFLIIFRSMCNLIPPTSTRITLKLVHELPALSQPHFPQRNKTSCKWAFTSNKHFFLNGRIFYFCFHVYHGKACKWNKQKKDIKIKSNGECNAQFNSTSTFMLNVLLKWLLTKQRGNNTWRWQMSCVVQNFIVIKWKFILLKEIFNNFDINLNSQLIWKVQNFGMDPI